MYVNHSLLPIGLPRVPLSCGSKPRFASRPFHPSIALSRPGYRVVRTLADETVSATNGASNTHAREIVDEILRRIQGELIRGRRVPNHSVGVPPSPAVRDLARANAFPSSSRHRADTDGGLNMPDEERAKVDALIVQLEQLGATQQPRPLDNDLLWGNYEVAYTSVSVLKSGTRSPRIR